MKMLVVFLVLFRGSSAMAEDLFGKVFVFPSVSALPHVVLTPDKEGPFSAATVCLRSFTDNKGKTSLFSVATPSYDNAFLLYQPVKGTFRVHINNKAHDFFDLPDHPHEWNSICWTWEKSSGLTQLWVNGKRSLRVKMFSDDILAEKLSIIIGQEQDTFGGGFDEQQCFVGELSDVHMWDLVLDSCEIQNYMKMFSFTPGNVLNWRELTYKENNGVLVKENQSKDC
ncbi:hypothetical protein JZ751_026488 [Albula glossodonta]|uniref:Pentraxin family member n=1 Tax=Albula glossodonta TaxID=121402 RepID=A0A8T2PC95_9TELE|nr:hypothetical protein JZ751_026488 [Albula glossodonta]